MKKSALVLGFFAMIPAFAEDAQEYSFSSSCTDCGYEATRTVNTDTYKKADKKTSKYKNTITNNFYYIQPSVNKPSCCNQRQDCFSFQEDCPAVEKVEVEQPTYTKKSYNTKTRKYFLAHPFFQPEAGRFGSVTDFSYAQNSFKFNMIDGTVYNLDTTSASYSDPDNPLSGISTLGGKAETSQMVVKEDFSYGISDDLALIGMVQYDKTDVKFKDWYDSSNYSWAVSEKSESSSGLNIFGIGLQYRFVDDPENIAMFSGYFQHQKDVANTFIGELKAGYKVERTTLYGLGRIGYSALIDGHIYGTSIAYDNTNWLMLSYKTNVDDVMYAEAGAGMFSVLNKYVTLNGELTYGYYDWHNQLNVKGALGFQPGDNFALNFYAMTSLYDSAKDKTLRYLGYEENPEFFPVVEDEYGNVTQKFTDSKALYTEGDYKLKDYNEWKFGVQAILYF